MYASSLLEPDLRYQTKPPCKIFIIYSAVLCVSILVNDNLTDVWYFSESCLWSKKLGMGYVQCASRNKSFLHFWKFCYRRRKKSSLKTAKNNNKCSMHYIHWNTLPLRNKSLLLMGEVMDYIEYISLTTYRLWFVTIYIWYHQTLQCPKAQSTLNWGKLYRFCKERSLYFVNVLRLSTRCLGALRRIVVITLNVLYSLGEVFSSFTQFYYIDLNPAKMLYIQDCL